MSQTTVQVNNLRMKAVADSSVDAWLASNPDANDTIPYEYLDAVNTDISGQISSLRDKITDIVGDAGESYDTLQEIVTYFQTSDDTLEARINTNLTGAYDDLISAAEVANESLITTLDNELTGTIGASFNVLDQLIVDETERRLGSGGNTDSISNIQTSFNNIVDETLQFYSNSNSGITTLTNINLGGVVTAAGANFAATRQFNSFKDVGVTTSSGKTFKIYEIDSGSGTFITLEEDGDNNLMFCKRIAGEDGSNDSVILQFQLGDTAPAYTSIM